jgi:hypothetical protein
MEKRGFGRPRIYGKNVIAVRLPMVVELRLRAAAEERGVPVALLIREALEPLYGDKRNSGGE